MKFGQLTKYNKRNIFLKTMYKKYGEENSPRLLINSLKVYTFFFKSRTIKILKLSL